LEFSLPTASLYLSGHGVFDGWTTTFQALVKPYCFLHNFACQIGHLLNSALYLQAYFWGLDGVWLALPVSDIPTAFLIAVLLIPQKKSLRRKRDAENKELPDSWNSLWIDNFTAFLG
jgi:Na+-driven multidrug efflux pump